MKKIYTFLLATLAVGASQAFATDISTIAAMVAAKAPARIAATPVAESTRALPASLRNTAAKAPAGSSVSHTWQSLGECDYTDDVVASMFNIGSNMTYKVNVDQDTSNPGFYRIADPVKAHPQYAALAKYTVTTDVERYWVIDARDPSYVILEPSDLGLVLNDAEEFYVYSYTWMSVTGEYSRETLESYGLTGKLADGVITFGKGALWVTCPSLDGDGRGYSANDNAAFRLALPGAKDYSLSLMGASWCAYGDQAIVAAYPGADVARVVAGTMTDLADEDQLQAILANPVELQPQTGAYIKMPSGLQPNQTVYLVGLALDAAGEVVETAVTVVYAEDNSADWAPIGKARFYDSFVCQAYDLTMSERLVDVEESTVTPGRYRLVNPYITTNYNMLTPSAHGNHNHYLYLDASDPDCVVLEEGPVGFITQTDGDSRICSRASQALAAGKTKEEVKAAGHGGKMTAKRITWPFEAYIYMGFLTEGADYWMNVNFSGNSSTGYKAGKAYVDLSETQGVADAVSAAVPAEYYNLQGIRVDAPVSGQLLIRLTPAGSQKVVY